MDDSVSISIPAYNEEGTLESLTARALKVLSAVSSDYEVIIIDDGSRDQTGVIADRLAAKDPHVHVYHHPLNLGFGPTLQEVFTRPSKKWAFFIPGDGQIPPEELYKLWPARERADFILGWRVKRQDPWPRRLTAAIYNLFISILLRQRIHDVDSVVLYRRDRMGIFRLTAQSVFIHAEFCLTSAARGARILEIPIDHVPRSAGEARGNKPGVILQTIKEMLAYAVRSLAIGQKGAPSKTP